MSNNTTSIIAANFLPLIFQLIVGVAMLIIGSYITIPVDPVPFTLQTYALLVIIFLMPHPRNISIVIVALYLLLGILGLPVFAPSGSSRKKSGWKTIAGVTGGYLWGFLMLTILFASYLTYYPIISISSSCLLFWHLFYLSIIGHGIILLCGVLQFTVQRRNFILALHQGFYPFLIPALLKSFLASLTVWLVLALLARVSDQ